MVFTEKNLMTLDDLRREIDRIDWEIMQLLQKRIEAVGEVGKIKSKTGLPLVDLKREEIIMSNVLRERREPLSAKAVKDVFYSIIIESRRVQIENSLDARKELFQII